MSSEREKREGIWTVRAAAAVLDRENLVREPAIRIRGGRIFSIERARAGKTSNNEVDLRPFVLIPGLVNAHAHLELTDLAVPRPPAGRIDLWIDSLLAAKELWPRERTLQSAKRGAALSLRCGTTAVGEIESEGTSAAALRRSPLRARVYREFFGLDPSAAEERMSRAIRSLSRKSGERIRFGLSPHSPYSLSPELFRLLGSEFRRRNFPIAIHLAESRGEFDLLLEGKGPLLAMFRRLGKIPDGWNAPRKSPLDFLASFGLLSPRTTVIHGNYLAPEGIRRLARSRTPVVFCPGSHRFFRYDPYPLENFLRAGVRVALGTDSLASNESLDLFREMALVRREFPKVSPRDVFAMATAHGARSLHFEDRIGALRPGLAADFLALDLPASASSAELFDRITAGRPAIAAVFIGGRRVPFSQFELVL